VAINISFNGATIYKPSAYSKISIDLSGGFPLSPTGLIAIFGEADAGTPGASEINISNNFFTPDQMISIRNKYKTGPIVDACGFLFSPGADGAIPGGAQAVYIYKTNASVRASLALAGAYATVRAKEWGVGGNRITLKIVGAGLTRTITLSQKRDVLVETATVGGTVVLTVTNATVGSTITIDTNNIVLFDGATTTTLSKSGYNSIQDLVSDINLLGNGWSAVIGTTVDSRLPVSVLDTATSTSVVAGASMYMNAYEVANFFAASQIADLLSQVTLGLPVALTETFLVGGVKGATLTAEVSSALSKFEKIRVNSVIPLFSRDATADKTDNLTDLSSTYTIDGINQAVKTHLSLMSTTKKKSERQGYLSLKDTYINCKTKIMTMAYARVQMMIQDIRNINSQGVIQWFQPWAGACLLAGARAGSSIGNPMTFKYFNMSGIRQTGQAMSTPEQNIVIDFDPDIQYDDGIISGLTFWEAPQTGGFRLVVDNTTYGKDSNWFYNRGHCQYAADVLAFDFRNQLENIYIGLKNTVGAAEIKSTCESILGAYLAQGITVSTNDAKNGYKQLVVQINGNVVNISLVAKLVEGIDFVLCDISLQRAQSNA